MCNNIYFFANFGNMRKLPFGGGEVGNRRTLAFLKESSYNVIPIPKYSRVKNHSILNLLLLGLKILWNITQYCIILFLGKRQNSVVHISGFYGQMIYFEQILISVAKLCGYKVIYEMRGGGAYKFYSEGSSMYRSTFRKVINKSDEIFSQGMENVSLIKKLSPNIRIFYYPNCVTNDFYPAACPIRSIDRIKLFYFGRLTPSKHIDVVVDTLRVLRLKFDNVYLDIVGDYIDDKYKQEIESIICQSDLKEFIRIFPACGGDELKRHLANEHFYIFPTTEQREGHSNALTEAMSWGLIPIATAQGFNRSVIDDDSLIVQSMNGSAFAEIIERIINDNQINIYSKKMYDRVMNNYTDTIVRKQLLKEYSAMFKRFFGS